MLGYKQLKRVISQSVLFYIKKHVCLNAMPCLEFQSDNYSSILAE